MNKIRVLIAMMGLDQHEGGALAVAGILRDAGMEVIYAGRFNLPAGIVQMALQEGADVIGLSCHSWEYLYYIPELIKHLHAEQLQIPIIVGGSVITPGDAKQLTKTGIAAVFGPGAKREEIVAGTKNIVRQEG